MLFVGITLGVLGSVFINTGNNLQSLGMAQLEVRYHKLAAEEEGNKKCDGKDEDEAGDGEIDTCESPTWVIGTVIFVTGALLNFAAFAFAPQSILAALEGIQVGACVHELNAESLNLPSNPFNFIYVCAAQFFFFSYQFVTNVLFGKFVLGSYISSMMILGTATTVLGVILTVLAASVVGTLEADVADLLRLWANPLWLAYVGFCVVFGAALQSTHKLYLAAASEGTPLPYSGHVLPVTYATFSALFGTFSVVLAKMLSEILTLQFEGTPIFWGPDAWFTYVTLFAWLAFMGIWLYRMNEALGLYNPLFIIPLLQVNFILFAIISGGIFFKEFQYFRPINTIGFILGVTLLVVGIFLLSPALDEDVAEEDGVQMEHNELPLEENGASLLPVPNKSSGESGGLGGDPPASVPDSTAGSTGLTLMRRRSPRHPTGSPSHPS